MMLETWSPFLYHSIFLVETGNWPTGSAFIKELNSGHPGINSQVMHAKGRGKCKNALCKCVKVGTDCSSHCHNGENCHNHKNEGSKLKRKDGHDLQGQPKRPGIERTSDNLAEWVKIGHISLTKADKAVIENGQWLNTDHIDAARYY